MQLYTDIYLLLNYSTCFRHPSCPSSGAHKTVVAASGTDHTIWGVSFFEEEAHSPDSVINISVQLHLVGFLQQHLKNFASQIV